MSMMLNGIRRVLRIACVILLAVPLCHAAVAKTAYQFLQEMPAPAFKPNHTLLPLTRASFPVAFDANLDLCERWGYMLEMTEDGVRHLDDPTSDESILAAKTKADPKRYPMFILMPRPLWNQSFLDSLPEDTWTHDANGVRVKNCFSPIMSDTAYQQAAALAAAPLKRLRQACPVAMVMNSGEYGMSVYGFNGSKWEQDPKILAAKGSTPWFDFISARQAHYEGIMTAAVQDAIPDVGNYLYYYTDGPPDRNRYTDYWQWFYDYKYMRPVSTIPNSSLYYRHLNTGFASTIDMLSQSLNSIAQQQSYGDKYCYNWLCAGWEAGKVAEDTRYMGYLKCLYTAGMLGAAAGYFTYPTGGFIGDQGTTPPDWLRQITILSHAHALFSHVDDFLRNGDLLPGPNAHAWSKDLPAYEFPTGDLTARVLARKHRSRAEWLVTAWAAAGDDRPVTVTIPTLGTITVTARVCGAVYRVKPGPVLCQLDPDGMTPTATLHNITATAGANGTLFPDGYIAVPNGGTETIAITPNPGYMVANVVVDGQSVGAKTSYTFSNITANHTISATFTTSTVQYGLNVQSSPAGIAINAENPTGITPYAAQFIVNTPISLTAPAKTTVGGKTYLFQFWTINDVKQPANQTNIAFSLAQTTTVNAVYVEAVIAPVAITQTVYAKEDTPVAIKLTGTDSYGAPLTFAISTKPNKAIMSGTSPVFTYSPVFNFFGTDTFYFTASNGVLTSAPAKVTVVVANVNDAPYSYAQTLTVPMNVPSPITLTGKDPDNDPLTYIVTVAPINGTLTGTGTNLTYTPKAGFTGTDAFTYKVFDGAVYSDPDVITLNVKSANTAPVAANQSLTTQKGVALNVTMQATDADGDTLTYTIVSQPSKGIVTSNSGGASTIYLPSSGQTGTDTFTFKVNDSHVDSNIATVTISIASANTAPVAVSQSVSVIAGNSKVITLSATDAENDALTYSLVTTPGHGTLTGTAPALTYTPAAGYTGSDSFTFTASDGKATSNTGTVTLSVLQGNRAPAAASDSYSVLEDGTLTMVTPGVLGNDTDADGNALTATLITNVTKGTLTLNSNGSFTYIPIMHITGTDSFTYKAFDGTAYSTAVTVTITITAVNDAPTATNDIYTLAEDTPLTVGGPGLLGNDSDPDGDALTAILVSGPAQGTLTLNANGSFTYIPTANTSSTVSFTYKTYDGLLYSAAATVTLTITAVNDAPNAMVESYTTVKNTTLTVAAPGVLANDSDVEGNALTAVLVATPTYGALSLNSDGSFVYTPNTGFVGTDHFTYTASDGSQESDITTVSLTVTGVSNDTPTAVDDAYTLAEDTSLTVTAPGLLANDSDADDNALTAVLVTGPASGTLTLNADGSFVYTPAANVTGTVSFTYTVSDGTNTSNIGTVTLTITAVNDAPCATADSFTLAEDTVLSVARPGVLVNDSDPDGNTLTTFLMTLPRNGKLVLYGNGTMTYTPNANFAGVDSFTYKAYDGKLTSKAVTVTLTVMPVNDAPKATNDTATTEQNLGLTVAAPGVLGNDIDIEGDALAAVLVTAPAHGTVTLTANGGYVYTPASGYQGSDSFTYRASDGRLLSAPATVTITVTAATGTPISVADSYATTMNATLVINDPGVLYNDSAGSTTALLVQAPANGTLTLQPDGSFTYKPNAGFTGQDQFSYVACNGAQQSVATPVVVSVQSPDSQPDMKIRLQSEATYTGNNIYNLDGTGQWKVQSVAPGTRATFIFTIQNDGRTEDNFAICGTAGTSDYTVRYYAASLGDITAQVVHGGWFSGLLAPGASYGFWATVTPTSTATPGQTFPLTVQAVSSADVSKADRVKAFTTITQP